MRTYIEDMVDILAFVLSVIIGVVVTAVIQDILTESLYELRGKQAFGGEFIFYIAVFAIVTILAFQVTSFIGHKIDSTEENN